MVRRTGGANRKFRQAVSKASYPRKRPSSKKIRSGAQASSRVGGHTGGNFDNSALGR